MHEVSDNKSGKQANEQSARGKAESRTNEIQHDAYNQQHHGGDSHPEFPIFPNFFHNFTILRVTHDYCTNFFRFGGQPHRMACWAVRMIGPPKHSQYIEQEMLPTIVTSPVSSERTPCGQGVTLRLPSV